MSHDEITIFVNEINHTPHLRRSLIVIAIGFCDNRVALANYQDKIASLVLKSRPCNFLLSSIYIFKNL